MTAPLVVVDDSDARDTAAASLVGQGWHRFDGFGLDAPGWSVKDHYVVCVGDVDDADDAAAAVLAAARGAALVVRAPADRRLATRLVDDLARLDDVDYNVGEELLGAQDREVLALVAQGYRVREIARMVHLSPRSVDRRLAHAREVLGVETTTEALALVFGPRLVAGA